MTTRIDLSDDDKRRCVRLGENALRACDGDRVLAALALITACESLVGGDDDLVRVVIAKMMIKAACRINPSVLDTRH